MASLPSSRKILLAIAAFATVATANDVGVGCHGSTQCRWWSGGHAIAKLNKIVDTAVAAGSGGDYFYSGQHIACIEGGTEYGGWCAFYQKYAAGNLSDVSEHLKRLIMSGCTNCGSSPMTPGGHVADGMLTVNYVTRMYCESGYCGAVPFGPGMTDNWDRGGFNMKVKHV